MAGKVVMPVELQVYINNLKEVTANLQNELQKVDVGSSVYRSIKTQLTQAERLVKNADLQVNIGITKQNELDRLLGNLQKSVTILDDVKGRFSNLSIKDLNLSDKAFQQPLQEIETLSRELERVQQQMSQMQNTNVATLLKDAGESLAGFSKGNLAKGATQFLDEIQAKSAKAAKEIENLKIARDKLNDQSNIARGQVTAASPYYQDVLRLSNEAKAFNANGRLTNSGIAQAYQNFINNSWNISEQKWNDADKVQSLLKLIGFDDEIIQKVIQSGEQGFQTLQNYFQNHQKGLTTIFSAEAKKAAEAEKGQAILDNSKKQIDDINKHIGTLEKNTKTYTSQAESVRGALQQKGYYNFESEINNIKNSIQQLWNRIEQIGRQGAGGPAPSAPGGAPGTEMALSKQQAGEQFSAALTNMSRRWVGTYAIISKVRQGIHQAWTDIQGLDKAMTNIAVVTDMSVDDLWGKINDYMSIAQQYGVTTQGVYEVSQLYYQQGLGTDEVMAATTETLKMARIAGMDYAAAANAMTVAIRSFKMEMTDAAHVTDVYSKVAAVTASDSEELATAMSKTASSAESVGSSFENTTAMLAVMIETTRESAQNLGSALKSIISRYGEMKSGLTQDSEGEEIDYNKTDAALKSVGISLKDAQGQFRDFDEVIFELAEKWDTLDKNTQRYIATVMAGNRQQSRFIALVDNWERLDEVANAAQDSEDAGLLQYSKTLDSLETKLNNIKTSFQQFYMGIIDGPFFKGILDFVNNIIQGFSKMGTLFSASTFTNLILSVKSVVTIIGALFKKLFSEMYANYKNFENQKTQAAAEGAKTRAANEVTEAQNANQQMLAQERQVQDQRTQGAKQSFWNKKFDSKIASNVAYSAQIIGSGLSLYGASLSEQGKLTGGAALGMAGNALSMGASGFMMSGGNPIGAVIGALLGVLSGLHPLIKSLDRNVQLQQDYENKKKLSDEAEIKRAETKDKYNNLNEYLTKLKNLKKTRYDSQENYDEWVKVNNQALEAFPELASTFDEANNAVVNLIEAENNLTQARMEAAKASKDAADAQITAAIAYQKTKENDFENVQKRQETFVGRDEQVLDIVNEMKSTYNTPESLNDLTSQRVYWRYTDNAGISYNENLANFYDTLDQEQQLAVDFVKKIEEMGLNQKEGTFTYTDDEIIRYIVKNLDDRMLKAGQTKDMAIKALTFNERNNEDSKYTFDDLSSEYAITEREMALSKRALENTVQTGIGRYVASDFLVQNEDYYNDLNNISKVFQNKLYKDFKNSLGEKDLTEDEWKDWAKKGYTISFQELSEWYESFYDQLQNNQETDSYNVFETNKKALTYDEYKLGLQNFGVDFGKINIENDSLGDELLAQFQEEYELAQKKFYEAIGTIDFLDNTKIFENFQFRQEYSDEIMSQARQLEKYADAGKITSEQARNYLNNYLNIWKEIDLTGKELNPDDLEKARKLLADADLTTPEGIIQFYEQLAEIYERAGITLKEDSILKLDENTVDNLLSVSLVNLNTSYSNLGKAVATKVDKMADQLNKAQKGFDNLSDVSEMVDSYGLSYSDFSFDVNTGKWAATQKVYDKIRKKEQANLEEEREAVNKAHEKQLSIISNNEGLMENIESEDSPLRYEEIKQKYFIEDDGTINTDFIEINNILEKNWDNYVDWYFETEESQRVDFATWMTQRHTDLMEELSKTETDFLEYINRETERQAKIDAKTAYDTPIKTQREQEAYTTLANNYSKLTKDQLDAIEVDLGWKDGALKQYLKDNQDGTYSVTRAFIASKLFSTLSPEIQNTIIASMESEFNAASEAISNLGSAAAGKADAGVYYEALKESGLSYEMLETLIPENIRLAAQGDKSAKEALKGVLKAANIEDVDTVYNNLINNYFDATKANVLTALDSIEKALDGTLDAQEFTELKTLDFGSYKIDFSAIKSSGELTLERYWQTIAEVIRNGASETDWGQYFEKAAKRSFDSAFGLEELEFDKEIAEASGKFSQELITDIAKQAKQILSPDVLSKFFVYDKITETYSANIQAIMAEAKLTEAEARSQWALQASVLMGFDYNAVMASFAGQDYAKLIKTDSIESSLNELIAAPSDITLESIKSLYEEIHGADTFVVSQDVATIDSFIQQAQEGAYDQIIGYIRNLYNEAIAAGYDVDTSEITTLIQQFYENIARNLKSALSDGIEGNLDTTTYNDLVKKYNVSGIKTTTGYGLTDDSQQKIISEWYKAAQASGSTLGFGEELWKTWADSAEAPLKSYRAISAEIEKAINKTDGLVSATDEYIAALQQARAAAYLDPNAYEFSFMEQDATGGLTENFDNFVSQIDTVKTTLDSLKSGTAIGYQEFYNLIDFIDNSGQWNTVSQKLGQGGKDIQEFANTIVEASGELGKVDAKGFAEVGLDMAASSEAMTEGMADGLKEVAEQQINYLEGLESMLLAMQALSEIGDISLGLSLDVNGQSMDVTLSQLEDFKAQLLEKYPIDKINYEINKALTSQASTINSAFEQSFGVENFDFMQLFFGGAFNFNDDTEVQIADALGTYISLLPNLTKDQAMSVGEQLFAAVGEGFVHDEQGNIIGINDSFQRLFTNFLKSFDASKISEFSSTAVREALGTATEKPVEIDGKTFTIKLGENGVPIVELPDGVTIDKTNKKDFENVVAAALGLEQVSIDLDSLEIKGLSKDKDSDEDNTLEVKANISPELKAVLDLIKDNPTIAITLSDEAWALLEALQPETAKTLRKQTEETKAAIGAANLYKQNTQPGRDALHIGEQKDYDTAIAIAKETDKIAQTPIEAKVQQAAEEAKKAELKSANLYKDYPQSGRDALHAGEQEAYAIAKEVQALIEAKAQQATEEQRRALISGQTADQARLKEAGERQAEIAEEQRRAVQAAADLSLQDIEARGAEVGLIIDDLYKLYNTGVDAGVEGLDDIFAPYDNLLNQIGKFESFIEQEISKPIPDQEKLNGYIASLKELYSQIESISLPPETFDSDENMIKAIQSLKEQTPKLPIEADTSNIIQEVKQTTSDIENQKATFNVSARFTGISGLPGYLKLVLPNMAWTGNMNDITGSALADGNAIDKLLAGANLANKTLVGELGPELAVYDGKYHMLGANGAEFVKLPSDAIVFNHLQTAGILNGQMNIRGQALAEGNVSGPALAGGGIDSALAAVRRAKAVWEGLLDNLTAAELTNAAGGGGGGGDVKNHSEELQEWYNLSRQISNIEQEINNILAERENITEGDSYLRSLREQQKLLREQANIQEVLLGYQQLQLKRQADIINNDRLWSRFLEVDESGLLQYTKGNELNGGKGALQVLQEMNEMSGEEQVKFLKDIGYTYTTVDGDELKEGELVQKFYEELQKQIDDYDALYDTVHETKETLEGIDTSINEIDEEIKQNQMDLEEAIFDIIVEAWEKQIEQMEEYNDLVKEANDKYIDGLNDALEKEKELYSQNETIAEREQLQRRLSLLRRSGGSASEIASLEEQLDDKLKDEYFKNQEDAIKNIQEANDRQVELLEQQVKLQQDSLEYQKEHGVIWSQVYDIMSGSTEEILAFMQGRKPEFFNQSLLQQEEMLTDWAMKIGIYTEDRQYQNHEAYARGSIWNNGNIFNNDQLKSLQRTFSSLTPEQQQQLQEYFSSVYATSRVGGADEATATQEAINALKRKMGDYSEQQGLASGSSSGKEEQKDNGGSGNKKPVSKYKFTYNGKEFSGFFNEASAKNKIEQLAQDYINKTLQYAGFLEGVPIDGKVSTYGSYGSYSAAIAAYNGIIRTANTHKGLAIGTIKPYSKGGLVDYTGLAMVHGSKSEPESFLNAEQTAQIREALILNGKTNTLSDIISTLKNLTANIKSIVSNNYNNQATSFTVSPGAVVVQVAELNDAYDIEDISNDIMSRITTIAEKATKRGVNRR